ncbi:MAG: hypothetical protein MUO77_15685, partial [Anaerolineales bacterium]|nr:hypothetical protein [Anaerolineales bacterium]
MDIKPTDSRALALCLISFLFIFACVFPTMPVSTTNPQADPNAYNTSIAQTTIALTSNPDTFNTALAQTAAAATPLAFGGGAANTNTVVPPQALSDEQIIKQALLAQLGWNESQINLTITASDGNAAYGMVKQTGQDSGAAWFAAKDSSEKWIIVHIGQSWPSCSTIQPYNFPVSYVSSCEDASGNIIDRSADGASAPPAQPTVAAPPANDVYAPNPLGPAWSAM